jgi:hypothetical protein
MRLLLKEILKRWTVHDKFNEQKHKIRGLRLTKLGINYGGGVTSYIKVITNQIIDAEIGREDNDVGTMK